MRTRIPMWRAVCSRSEKIYGDYFSTGDLGLELSTTSPLTPRLSFSSCWTTGCTLSAPLPFSSSAFGSPAAPIIWSAALYRNPAISTKCCVAFSARSPAISSSRHSARGAVPIWHPDHQLSRRHRRCLPGDRFGSTRHTLEILAAGVMLLIFRPFRIGHSVTVGRRQYWHSPQPLSILDGDRHRRQYAGHHSER